ncbi:MAG: helix-turn-helix domain-containing protein [Candidatus Lokiarchaeota archaeon]|nr:helix-turn-helix domain-containing protein [Candidatus Lokiarchaeota archaeon]MBD3202139.1 helix-turn-helix domain-containing protein [Candidatus Lokiarchaeota archaeon]
MNIPKDFRDLRKDLELLSEKTRYKILLTLFASEKSLSFSQLKEYLPSIQDNSLHYHLNILKENNLIKNRKKNDYKRSEDRSFYSLNNHSLKLLERLGLSQAKKEFQALFNKLA